MNITEPDDSKSLTVFAAIIMTFSCPHCGEPVEIKSKAVPHNDFEALCPKCKVSIRVKPNHRHSNRKKVSIPLAYLPFDSDTLFDRIGKKGTMIDISNIGLSIKADMNKFPELYEKPGNILVLFFSLRPKDKVLNVKGEIVNVTPGRDKSFQMGVKFLHLTQHHKKAIGSFLMP